MATISPFHLNSCICPRRKQSALPPWCL